jgi:hypothetical protein
MQKSGKDGSVVKYLYIRTTLMSSIPVVVADMAHNMANKTTETPSFPKD